MGSMSWTLFRVLMWNRSDCVTIYKIMFSFNFNFYVNVFPIIWISMHLTIFLPLKPVKNSICSVRIWKLKTLLGTVVSNHSSEIFNHCPRTKTINYYWSGWVTYSAVVRAALTVVGLNPHQYLWTHDLQVCGLKRLGYPANLYTISSCRTRGESEDHTGRYHQKSKTGVSVTPQKALVSSKTF